MQNYQHLFSVENQKSSVFNALTRCIPQWWTEMFEGSSAHTGDTFTIRFGENIFKTIRVVELFEPQKLVWKVEDSMIDIPQLQKQDEWNGTTITWEMKDAGVKTHVQLTHEGLTPEIECYEICEKGWEQFVSSLKSFVETGVGMPFKPLANTALSG